MTDCTTIGARIRQARRAARYSFNSAYAAMKELGFTTSRSSLQRWEMPAQARYDLRALAAACRLYGVSLEWIVYGEEKKMSENPKMG